MRTLDDRRAHGFPCEALEKWFEVPRVQIPPAPPAHTDRSSPPLRLVRFRLQELDDEVRSRLGLREGEDELEFVRSCAIHKLRSSGVWKPMRLRNLLALSCVLGGRPGAACDLRRTELIAVHHGPDGRE